MEVYIVDNNGNKIAEALVIAERGNSYIGYLIVSYKLKHSPEINDVYYEAMTGDKRIVFSKDNALII